MMNFQNWPKNYNNFFVCQISPGITTMHTYLRNYGTLCIDDKKQDLMDMLLKNKKNNLKWHSDSECSPGCTCNHIGMCLFWKNKYF